MFEVSSDWTTCWSLYLITVNECQVGFLIFFLIETFFKDEFHDNLLRNKLLH